jgi:ribosomal protein S18 acetylase RimI-like enzyme
VRVESTRARAPAKPSSLFTRCDTSPPRAAYYNDIFTGAVCCTVQTGEDGVKRLYVMALAVLAAYRGYGIGALGLESPPHPTPLHRTHLTPRPPLPLPPAGSALVQSVLDAVAKAGDVKEVYLHVWTKNEEAVRFYETKFGFSRDAGTVANYYRRIDPPDAYVLRLAVNGGTA